MRQCVRATLTDSTSVIAEDTSERREIPGDIKHEYNFSAAAFIVPYLISLALCTETLAAMQVDKDIRLLTERARFDGQICIDGIADAEQLNEMLGYYC